jgi:hypothetical protein
MAARLNKWLMALGSLGLLAAPSAWAYRISGHDWITHAAIEEFNACHPGTLSRGDAFVVTLSDAEEDANLIRKWTEYSHFYNPEKKLNMRRADSSVRLTGIDMDLVREMDRHKRHTYSILIALGHALHHIQDMTSPPHVVPVMHGLGDTYEKHEIDGQKIAYAAASGNRDCGLELTDASSLEEILTQTARETLRLLGTTQIDAQGTSSKRFDESAFWLPSSNNDFGSYGELGNHFGSTRITLDSGIEYRITAETYQSIWERQLRLAVDASKRAIALLLLQGAL